MEKGEKEKVKKKKKRVEHRILSCPIEWLRYVSEI
jgi:hypothetical protein